MKNILHHFKKTRSTDEILPNIITKKLSFQQNRNFKNNINLKISIQNDNNNSINNKNFFYTLNRSNFSTTNNSLSVQNRSKTKSFICNNNNTKILRNSFSFNNLKNTLTINKTNKSGRNNNFLAFHHTRFAEGLNYFRTKIKKEYLSEYIDKIKRTSIYKYTLIDKIKLVQLEKEKIETNLDQFNLNVNLFKKLKYLFKAYFISLDNYLSFLKIEIKNGTKENNQLKEDKKELYNEIFILGHRVYKIKNKLRDYLNNKYFLLSVKNHTKNFEFFSVKDKKEFNNDLYILEKLDQQLNNIFLDNTEETEEKKENDNDNDKENIDRDEEKSDKSLLKKDKFKRYVDIRKTFFSQKTLGDLHILREIFNTPEEFMKDLNLISKGINKSLKTFNKKQLVLLEDKKLLNMLIEKSHDNEKIEKEFHTVKNKLNNILNYYNYLKNNKNNLIPYGKKNKKKEDILQNKIKSILDNIKKFGSKKLLKYLDEISNEEFFEKYDILCKNKLYMLEMIENSILFLKKNNNEYKNKDKDNYKKMERKIRYLNHINSYRISRKNEEMKKRMELMKSIEKNYNLYFLPNKKNFFINSNKIENKLIKVDSNKKIELKKSKTVFDIDLDY